MKKLKNIITALFIFVLGFSFVGCFGGKDEEPRLETSSYDEFVEYFQAEEDVENKCLITVNGMSAWIDATGSSVKAKIVCNFESEDYEIYLFNNKCYTKHVKNNETSKFVFNLNFSNIRAEDYASSESRVIKVVNIVWPLSAMYKMHNMIANDLNIAMPAPNARNTFKKVQYDDRIKFEIDLAFEIEQGSDITYYDIQMDVTYKNGKLVECDYKKEVGDSDGYSTLDKYKYNSYSGEVSIPGLVGYEQAH
ncbi:MAG: hypothetical protein IJW24_02340 [Clostridia bacterium]|nr:hypothetical protein [Clostridia bacterium]